MKRVLSKPSIAAAASIKFKATLNAFQLFQEILVGVVASFFLLFLFFSFLPILTFH
jgi:hypothetical protein